MSETHYSKFLANPQLFERLRTAHAPEDIFSRDREIDHQLGFEIEQIERQLQGSYSHYNKSTEGLAPFPKGQAWIGLGAQLLQTPYHEIYEALKFLEVSPPKSLLDLGAGYGRIALVLKALYPTCRFTGLEFVPERVQEAKRVFALNELDADSISNANILEIKELPKFDSYFLYDFGKPSEIESLLEKFTELFSVHDFFLIVKGKATRSLIHNKFPLLFRPNGAKHFENISIYSSFFNLEDSSL